MNAYSVLPIVAVSILQWRVQSFTCIFYLGLIQHVPFHQSTVNNIGQGYQVVTNISQ